MKRTSVSYLAALLATVAVPALAPSAGAHAQTASSPTATDASHGAGSTVTAPTLSKPMLEKVDAHIKQLHDELGITATEEPLWRQYAQVMRDNAAQMEQALVTRGADVDSMDATENMQSYAQLAQVHATNMQKLASTFQSLYSSFSKAQKENADNVFRNEHHKPLPSKD